VFWGLRDPEKTIVVELNHERYQKLIIEVDNPEAAVKLINDSART
jgi:hypothetical protein